jgi:hypothetical protein
MEESDYLFDNLMQKPFAGKEKYIFSFILPGVAIFRQDL